MSKPMTKLQGSLLKEMPEWMFVSMPHILSKDPAEVRWACPEHGVQEPIQYANGYQRRECTCVREQRYRTGEVLGMAGHSMITSQRQLTRTYAWLGRDATEPGLEGKTFATFDRSFQTKAYDDARWFAEQIVKNSRPGNMLMTGPYGTGKTHLEAAILNECRARNIGCLFATVPNLFNAIYSAGFEAKQQIIAQAASTMVLALDDLDKLYIKLTDNHEDEGKYQKSMLFDILNKRYTRRLPTIITTNEEQDLGKWLDGATISRLYERITLLRMAGKDYRLLTQPDKIRSLQAHKAK